MKDTVKRVRRITEYAETALRTETINLKLLPTDAAALWDARNKRSVVVCIDDAENTGAHLSTMHTGPVTASHPQDPGLKSVIQPPQAESDPTVQMVADWQLKLERWRIIHHGAASKAINQMFRSHEGRSAFRIEADDFDEILAETWAAIWTWLMEGEVRTNPTPPRRPNGTSITKGKRLEDVLPRHLEAWICKIAKSRADELARKRCSRNQQEELRRRLLREEPNGTATFPQRIHIDAKKNANSMQASYDGPASRDRESFEGDNHAAWEGEPSCDPRTAMSLRPGPGLIMGLVKGAWEGLSADSVMDEDSGSVLDANRKKHGANNPITHNELFTAVQESWKFNWDGSMPVTQVSKKRWEDLMEHQPITVFADDKTYRYDHPFKPEKDLTVYAIFQMD
jgi:hypothetical protein